MYQLFLEQLTVYNIIFYWQTVSEDIFMQRLKVQKLLITETIRHGILRKTKRTILPNPNNGGQPGHHERDCSNLSGNSQLQFNLQVHKAKIQATNY